MPRETQRQKLLTRRAALLAGGQALLLARARRAACTSCRSSRRTAMRCSPTRTASTCGCSRRRAGASSTASASALADNRQNYRVVVVPEQAGDIEATLDALGTLIEVDRSRPPPRPARRQAQARLRAGRRARQSELGRDGADRGRDPGAARRVDRAGADPLLSVRRRPRRTSSAMSRRCPRRS